MFARTVHFVLAAFLLGQGSAQFGPRMDLHTGASFWDPLVADVDNDGDNDILLKDPYLGIQMLENLDGLGSFGPLETIVSIGQIERIVVSDLDGDLDMDIVGYRFFVDELLWFANDGTGSFGPGMVLSTDPGYLIHCTDLSGSALADIVFSKDSSVYWFENDGGTFQTLDSVDFGAPVKLFDVGDIDLDGDNDLAVHTTDLILVGLNPDSGAAWTIVALSDFEATGHTYGKRLIDCDGDSDLDIVDAAWQIRWVENLSADSGSLAFAPEHMVDPWAPNEGAGWAAPLGCGPGASILWCHWVYAGPIYWSHYDASVGGFSAPVTTGLRGAGDGRLALGDLNGDGAQDVINTHNDTVSWYANELPAAGGSAAVVPALDTLCAGNSAPYQLPVGTPANGRWTGPCVEYGSYFDPTSYGQGAGSYPMSYGAIDAQGCIASAFDTIQVINEPTMVCLDPDPECPGAELHFLGSPSGGAWNAPTDADGRLNTDCALRPIFTDVVYTFTDVTGHPCPSDVSMTVNVLPCTPVAIGAVGAFCVDAPPQPVQVAVPAFGVAYFLQGVDSSTYDGGAFVTGWLSGSQGPGIWPVVAAAVGQGECPSTDTVLVEVWPLPVVTFDLGVDTLSDCTAPVPLDAGVPAGGSYFINGADSSSTVFEVATWGQGTHVVAYTYTDGNGCTASATDTLVVDCSTGLPVPDRELLQVWPMPASDVLHVLFSGQPQRGALVDALGRVVLEWQRSASPVHLDVSALQQGIHVLRLEDGRTQRVMLR